MPIVFHNSLFEITERPHDAEVKWRISGYAFVQSSEGKILMIRSKMNDTGRFQLPGGGTEILETMTESVVREVNEETGYRVRVAREQPLYFNDGGWYRNDRNEYYHIVYGVFLCDLVSDTQDVHVINTLGSNETFEVVWKDPNELTEENCFQRFWPLLKQYKK
jgi:8-oxo-dGTP pyrophosphatase MutT (NUDIX family)